MKNRRNLTEKQEARFKSINKQNTKTAKAYQMKIKMQEIYNIVKKLRKHPNNRRKSFSVCGFVAIGGNSFQVY